MATQLYIIYIVKVFNTLLYHWVVKELSHQEKQYYFSMVNQEVVNSAIVVY